jgi:L-ascorbate metabolism protein UlaG (beta-lactamase superfamily)
MRAWEQVRIGDVTVTALPAEHDGRRNRVGAPAPALGYVVSAARSTVYFAGDTGLHAGMAHLRDLHIGLALLPVGGWGLTLGSEHLDPAGAAQALLHLAPTKAVPIHWGGLRVPLLWRARTRLFTEPGADFAREAARVAPQVQVQLAQPGSPVDVPRRPS